MNTITLSTEQQAVINAALNGTSNIACIAAAGSGKTTMLTHLVNHVVKASRDPEHKKKRVLVLSFNKAAANDFCEKLVALDPVLFERTESHDLSKTPYKASEDVARTFDSWLPKRDGRNWFGGKEGLCLDFNRRKREEGWLRAVETTNTYVGSLFPKNEWVQSDEASNDSGEDEKDETDTSISGRLWALWGKCWLDARAYPSTLLSNPFGFDSTDGDHQWSVLRRVFAAFERWCGASGVWTMCDVYLSLHKKVTRGGVALENLREELRADYDLIIVDEAQDNSHMQNDIIQALCQGEGRPGPRLLMVGDPRQCIYEWRGASPRQLINFANQTSTIRLDLTTNRRSLPHIVKRADDVIRSCGYGPDSVALRDGSGLLREGETRASMVQMCVNLSRQGKPLGIMMLSYANKDKNSISAELLASGVPHTVDGGSPGNKDVVYASKRVGMGTARDVAERTRAAVQAVRRRPTLAPLLVALLETAQVNALNETQLLAWYARYKVECLKSSFNLSTIHKAKGKEEHIVIVRNPTLRDPTSEVSARMMYVAMTRAKDHLFVFDVPDDDPYYSEEDTLAPPPVGITDTDYLD